MNSRKKLRHHGCLKDISEFLDVSRFVKILATVCILLSATLTANAQNQNLKLPSKTVTISEFFTAIEKQTDLLLVYSDVDLNVNSQVSFAQKEGKLKSFMDQFVKDKGIRYEFTTNKYIVLSRSSIQDNKNTSPDGKTVITGTVTDKTGEPLVGATVMQKGTKNGVITNFDGEYTIEAPIGSALIVSYVGYESKEVKATKNARIILDDDSQLLKETVVVGYAVQKKANLTGAVASVDASKQFEGRVISDVGRGLQGAVAGLTVTDPQGEVGSNPKMKIRGAIGSYEGGSSPLILLDNVEIPSLQVVNPDDIESITILKDAASASIYGSKGAFGVVLLTSKKGAKTDKVSFSYTGNFAWENLSKDYDMAGVNGLQYMLDCRAREKDSSHTGHYSYDGLYTGSYFRVSEQSLQMTKDWIEKYGSMGADDPVVYGRDWFYESGRIYGIRPYNIYDYIIRENAPSTKHNITVNGKKGNTTFNIGLGYLSQDGMFSTCTDNFKKYNASVKLETEVNKFLTIRGGMMYSTFNKKYPFLTESGSDGPWIYLYRWSPLMAMGYNEDGEIIRSAQSATMQAGTQSQKTNYSSVNMGVTITPLKNWQIKADYTYYNKEYIATLPGSTLSAASYRDTPVVRRDANGNKIYVNNAGQVVSEDAEGAMLSYKLPYMANYNGADKPNLFKRNHENSYSHTLNAYTDYTLRLMDVHDFKFMVGMNLTTYDASSQYTQVTELTNFENPQFAFGTGTWTGGGGASWSSQLGYFGRLNYIYADKYLFEANLRYDGTSKFPTDMRWKWFPSFSAGWRVSEEKFMEWTKPVISSMKVRGSWGSIGDQTVSSSLYIPTMSTGFSSWIGGNGTRVFYVNTPSAISASISWQKIETLGVGVDLRLLNNELGVTFDWYQRDTKNMIVPTDGVNTITYGASAPKANNGQLRTKGWELSIDYNHRFANGLGIYGQFNIADNKSVVKKFGDTKNLSDWYVGKEYGEIWGFKVDRLYQWDDFETDANGNLIYRELTAADTDDQDCIGKFSYILKPNADGSKPVYQSYFEGSSFHFGPGDVKYKDVDGNGKLTKGTKTIGEHGDLVKIGNSTPRLEYSFRLGADWKGFDLSLMFQGIGKRKIWGQGPLCIAGYKYSDGCMAAAIADDYWREDHTDAFYPAAMGMGSGNDSYNFMVNDRYILNMAYLRLKNLTFGYTMPYALTSKIGVDKARLYFTAENLLTWDHLRGLPIDSEVETGNTYFGSPQDRTGVGTPTFKTVSIGIQLNF